MTIITEINCTIVHALNRIIILLYM